MGRLLNTTFQDTVNEITGLYDNLVNNPFYIFNENKPVSSTYYNINKTFTSLDPGSKLAYDQIGDESPIRYNRIYDFLIYGFPQIELSNENGEYGLENEKIEVDIYLLPNTIVPYEGDYFEVSHIKQSTLLFQVTDVQKDTLDNGSNVYKAHAKLEYTDHEKILKKIEYNYRMVFTNDGTNMATVLRCEDYEIAKFMDKYAVMLKGYYNDLFYNSDVQTYTYEDLTVVKIYDSYMIEFLLRNDIMLHGEQYIHVMHQIPTQRTFSIDYDHTIFRYFEEKNSHILESRYIIGANLIQAYGTIFDTRYDDYYSAVYYKTPKKFYSYCLREDIIYAIENHELVEDVRDPNGNSPIWKNIIIKYFYDEPITEDEVKAISEMDFEYSKDAFYLIPIMIFCLEQAIDSIINQHKDNN